MPGQAACPGMTYYSGELVYCNRDRYDLRKTPIMNITVWLTLLFAFAGSLANAAPAAKESAGAYPARPVRLIVPYPPGGGNDTLARLFGQKLTERWSQQVVVDNRPGAGTTIGAQLVARSAPDGYTLLLSSIATHALAPALYSRPGYDPIADFTPITVLAEIGRASCRESV